MEHIVFASKDHQGIDEFTRDRKNQIKFVCGSEEDGWGCVHIFYEVAISPTVWHGGRVIVK